MQLKILYRPGRTDSGRTRAGTLQYPLSGMGNFKWYSIQRAGAKESGKNLWNGRNTTVLCVHELYLLLAFKEVGWLEKADKMWDMWRHMVENNLTTCVENTTDERSDCHAWGALILYALPAVYLGIRPTKPGFAEYEQKPDLGHLKWIKGEIITPSGLIKV